MAKKKQSMIRAVLSARAFVLFLFLFFWLCVFFFLRTRSLIKRRGRLDFIADVLERWRFETQQADCLTD
jgi:uncharacterized SAM-binding protein YcdF (DUF218 family)